MGINYTRQPRRAIRWDHKPQEELAPPPPPAPVVLSPEAVALQKLAGINPLVLHLVQIFELESETGEQLYTG